MRTLDRFGRPIREPTYRTIHDREAAEPEPRCYYCGERGGAVTNEGDTCSPECEEAQLRAEERARREREEG
jgi:predicted nucleic acid-binding Zn ribbon protein